MIYLTTGANGAGKTALTIWDVRQQQLKENRPVFYHGFEALQAIKDFGWTPFNPKDWQDLPDGSICLFDEAQNDFPVRRAGSDVPGYIKAVAEFRRKRGFDFWLCTPHPRLLDVFIRSLIDNPSYHRHVKRMAGALMCSVTTYGPVNMQCEKPGASDKGELAMRALPKEVFGWYQSAELHTARVRVPKAVIVAIAGVVLVPLLIGGAVYALMGKTVEPVKKTEISAQGKPAQAPQAPQSTEAGGGQSKPVQTAAQYIAAHVPRIDGMPHTAPAFDQVTQPTVAPYPAACVMGVSPATRKQECWCYSQQGTKLLTPLEMCAQVVRNGFFMEWGQQSLSNRPTLGAMSMPPAPDAPKVTTHDGAVLASMRDNTRRPSH